MKLLKYSLGLLCFVLAPKTSFGQFNLDGQMLIRSEYRNGYNEPILENMDPAGFIAHRARLQAGYTLDDFNFFMSVQDVRTWGSTPQANISDGFLSVHEAWGEFKAGEYWKIKLGRQELNYDNARFLGNLDWALQARSHDFALVKYEKGNSKLHFGGGFNQVGQRLSDNFFSTPNQYRSAQLVHYEDAIGNLDFSLLFWNEGRQNPALDPTGQPLNDDIHFRQTVGIPTLKTTLNKTTLSGYFYYQFGKDINGFNVSAYNASAQISQLIFDNQAGRKWRATLGYEVISGTDGNVQGTNNNSYSLQYGTNHLFNGLMDWFFVANRWENNVGLHDIYLRSRYSFNDKFWIQANGHLFSSYADPLGLNGELVSDKSLGTELDFTFGVIINNSVSLQGGYSQLFLSDAFENTQIVELNNTQNWAYLMFVFRPNSKAKFIGVLQ
ncbi:alginate export family protein [Muricauda sp. SCSIO 64092]|uniref:alginate export family protein n=1 Tax=Allomuricauda sp. SCSIO 64092 TaxID=2908842 RepID=UPI001FF646A3|nr:alginate export family protein [Muricauda sp. SCSIO 64092]UOY09054.1 alginate export family protein [Muricauda sp. SCSIO 64092]